ncbi:MAG: four helix bundle protein [Chloroflexia bacterium]|nr:four helix bundle protein [Chloroflexia bacterium]
MQPWDVDVQRRTLVYANKILDVVDRLPNARSASILANQLGRSATSVMANHAESTRARSVAEKIAKQGLCLQELQESHAWLALLKLRTYCDVDTCDELLKETDELIGLFVASIKRFANQ